MRDRSRPKTSNRDRPKAIPCNPKTRGRTNGFLKSSPQKSASITKLQVARRATKLVNRVHSSKQENTPQCDFTITLEDKKKPEVVSRRFMTR